MKLARMTWTAAVAALCLAAAPAAQAQSSGGDDNTVILKSFDGFTQLRGKMLDFDGKTFTIETPLGVIQVDGLQVNCEGEACPQNLMFGAVFGVHGSNTIGAELMPALVEGYADTLDATLVTEIGTGELSSTLKIMHDDGREMAAIDLQSYGSSTGFRGLGDRTAEIAMSSRRLRDGDLAALATADIPELRDTENEHVLALDGLVVITHPRNPIQSVSLEDLALIFSGAITNWSQLGGPNLAVTLYARDADSGTYQTFESLVLDPYDVSIAPTTQRFASNTQLSDAVVADPGGIGVTAIAYQRATKALPIRQECGILSYPTTFEMKTEEYPLSRRLYLYTPTTTMAAHAKQLVDFAMSPEAQPIIAEAGFVNQAVESLSINHQGSRLVRALTESDEAPIGAVRDMFRDLGSAERLSLALRFTPGSSQLEPKSASDAQRLARDIAAGEYEGKEILLVGFTDSVGQFELNRGLSLRRASVAEEVIRNAVPAGALSNARITVLGYGELSPVGCNTTLQGRSANRRVEVWIRDLQ